MRLLDLASLLPFSGLKFFTIYDESDAEEEYTVEELSDYDNKMWLHQHFYLFNVKMLWMKKILDKVHQKLTMAASGLLRDTSPSHDVALVDSIFLLSLKNVNDAIERVKQEKWIRPDMEEEEYPSVHKRMRRAEADLRIHLKNCKFAVKKALRDINDLEIFPSLLSVNRETIV